MSADLSTVAATLSEWERTRGLSGSFLVTRRGETLLEHACGHADRVAMLPNTPATRFGLASVTKVFTAVAIARLAGAGRVDFSAPVVRLLPPERRPSTLRDDVTVHHLLCHTSGIADYFEEEQEPEPEYADLWAQRPCYRIERPADFLPLFGDLPPYRPPGERWQYSNAGYVLLGLVLEELTGSAYSEVVVDQVFEPAQMEGSGFFRLDEPQPDLAQGYLPRAGPSAPWRTNIYSIPVVGGADGGSFSTARDLDRFLHAVADGTLLGELTATLLTRHADAGEGFASGYGVMHYPDGRYGHGGADPGVEVLVNRWPEEDLHVIVLLNHEGPAGEVRDLLAAAGRG